MATIEISKEEVESGQIALANHAAAVYALQTDGFVVLKDIIDTAHLDLLRDKMLADLDTILQRPDVPFNFNTGNVQQDPPPFLPYLFRDVLVNDIVIAVTKSLLGPNLKNTYYSGNTALPGGTRQPVHPDVAQLWPDLPTATPAFGLVVNVPVVDMDERNGSTEIWPGTHLDTTYNIHQGSARILEEVLERRRALVPPIQPAITRGSVVIRDIRLWHAGMPNQTNQPRPMIAMIHWCSWWAHSPVPFAAGTEAFFEHPDLNTDANFMDEPIDYLHHNAAYDLQK